MSENKSYRILKIYTLPNKEEQSWVDRDYIMLNAMFQVLTDFIEKENGFGLFDVDEYYNDPGYDDLFVKSVIEQNKVSKIGLDLYDWWKNRRPAQLQKEEEQSHKPYNSLHYDMELARYKEEKEMMHKLVEIYDSMWT